MSFVEQATRLIARGLLNANLAQYHVPVNADIPVIDAFFWHPGLPVPAFEKDEKNIIHRFRLLFLWQVPAFGNLYSVDVVSHALPYFHDVKQASNYFRVCTP